MIMNVLSMASSKSRPLPIKEISFSLDDFEISSCDAADYPNVGELVQEQILTKKVC